MAKITFTIFRGACAKVLHPEFIESEVYKGTSLYSAVGMLSLHASAACFRDNLTGDHVEIIRTVAKEFRHVARTGDFSKFPFKLEGVVK